MTDIASEPGRQPSSRTGNEPPPLPDSQIAADGTIAALILGHLPVGVLVAEAPSGRIIAFNDFAEQLLGQTLRGLNDVSSYVGLGAIGPDGTPLRPEAYPMARTLLAGAVIDRQELRCRRGDGSPILLSVSAAPVRDETGRILRAVCVLTDIAPPREREAQLAAALAAQQEAMRRLREGEERLRFAQEVAGAGTWDWDIEAGRVVWSEEYYKLCGLPPSLTPSFGNWLANVHPDDRERVRVAVGSILRNRQTDFRTEYRILHPEKGLRWLASIRHVVYDSDGRARRMVGLCIDITSLKLASESLEREVVVRRRAEAAMRDSERQLRLITDAVPVVIAYVDAAQRYCFANAAYEDWFAVKPEALLGRTVRELVGEAAYAVARPHVERVLAGETVSFENFLAPAGRPPRSVLTTYIPHRDDEERIVGFYILSVDMTERKQAEERQTLLMAELDHRVKNTLASIQSMVAQTARTQPTREAFAIALQGRIDAMARAHSLLTQSRWEGAALRDLALEELRPHGGEDPARATIAGGRLILTPKAALAMSLVLHELTTNAVKYGALSTTGGRVAIHWDMEGDPAMTLRLEWSESGGPPVMRPERRGFGSTLIERTLTYEFQGTVKLDYARDGLRCHVSMPLDRIAAEVRSDKAQTEAQAMPPAPRRRIAGARVLVAEDSLLVALDIESALQSAGAHVVGPAMRLDEAMRLAESERPDAAVLDIDLDGERVFPVADRLAAQGVPFVFSTGYDARSSLPETYRHVPAVRKPFAAGALIRALEEAVAAAR